MTRAMPAGLRAAASVAVLVAVMTGASMLASRAGASGSAEEGPRASAGTPPFNAVDLDGRPHSLAEHAGQVVVLHFWATWCPYCRGEIPELRRIHAEMAEQGVRVVSVSVDEDLGALRRYVATSKLPYPVIPDVAQDFAMAEDYAVLGVPMTYVIGRDGRIVSRVSGPGDTLGAVRRALEASAGSAAGS